jgi:succinate dehydrogenase / fumarate reductase, cytochrome b subunit
MTDTATPSRPLSPHLQIYRWPITMVMSIAHRITGGALYFGTLLLIYLLISAAAGPHAYEIASSVFGSIPGRLVLFGYTFALIHHMFGGIRHFVWDTGRGMEPGTREALAFANVAGSIGLTLLVWAVALIWFWDAASRTG